MFNSAIQKGMFIGGELAIPSDIKSLITATGGVLKAQTGPSHAYAAAAGQVPDGLGGVQVNTIPPVHPAGYYGGPAYSNLLINSSFIGATVGSPGDPPTGWGTGLGSGEIVEASLSSIRVKASNARAFLAQTLTVSANTKYIVRFDGYVFDNETMAETFCAISIPSGASYKTFVDGVEIVTSNSPSVGQHEFVLELTISSTAGTASIRVGVGCQNNFKTGEIRIQNLQATVSYIFPYIASPETATISVVSTVGSTTGNGIQVPLTGSDAGDALSVCFSGGVGTVGVLMKMGVSYLDVQGKNMNMSVLSCRDSDAEVIYTKANSTTVEYPILSNDGVTTAAIGDTNWDRNEYHMKFVEFNGTQFRVGNKRYTEAGVAIDADIVWSHATLAGGATFDGSFNPTTFLRWFLNSTVPNWMRAMMVSNLAGLGDTEILRRMHKYGKF